MKRVEVNILTGERVEIGLTPEELSAAQIRSLSELPSTFTALVQNKLDQTARTFGYDDIRSAVSYADEPAVPKFQKEGEALREWRSLVWQHCYTALEDVQAGRRTVPTVSELLAELPSLQMPQ